MYDKYRKWLIIILVIFFVAMSITTSIMSGCTMHTEHCDLENCSLCIIINMSVNLAKNIEFINTYNLILIVTVPLIQLIKRNIQKEVHLTLVDLKVVQNN